MEYIKVFYKLDDGAKVPVKLNDETDAGYDVYAASEPEIVGDLIKEYGEEDISNLGLYNSIDYIQYRTGLYLEPADRDKIVRFDLRPRSSISKYWLSLCNTPATIDHTYGNEILVRFRPVWQPANMAVIRKPNGNIDFLAHQLNQDKIYQKGDRICQLLPSYVIGINWVQTNCIDNNRGGFGSTGK